MPADRKPIFEAVKALRGGKPWIQSDVDILDHAIDQATGELTPRFAPPAPPAPPIAAPATAQFVLGTASTDKLSGLKSELAQCVQLAIRYTLVDFRVQETLRTEAEQAAAVAAGNSRTMKSKHLPQPPDGKAWAVDLTALVDGVVSWKFDLYAAIAAAMDRAATELGIAGHVRWGCAWDRVLSDFGGNAAAYLAEAKAYADRHPGSDLLDGPHFEWVA